MPKITGIGTGKKTGRLWWDHPRHATPWMPEDHDRKLADLAVEVIAASARLEGALPQPGRAAVTALLRFVNSYYSNLIEGHATLPGDIERAMRKDYREDPTARSYQIEARVHVEIERRMRIRMTADRSLHIAGSDLLGQLHREFFQALPRELRTMRRGDAGPEIEVVPGSLRTDEVTIGSHDPPTHASLPRFMEEFARQYDPSRLSRVQSVIAAAAAHHRLLWIHPFADGNGRVARLFAQACLIRAGVDVHGTWSISRGLARRNHDYRAALAGADAQRAGDTDGRGQLSAAGLHGFCAFFLEVALDQITFIERLLRLDQLLERLAAMAADAERRKTLPPRAGLVLREALLRGPLSRGEALELFGQAERTSRNHLADVLASGLLVPEGLTHRSAVSFAIPTAYGAQLFPDLYPIDRAEDREQQSDPGLIARLRAMSPAGLRDSVGNLIRERIHELTTTREIRDLIRKTHVIEYLVDDWGISSDGDIDLSADDAARVFIHFSLSGEPDPGSAQPDGTDPVEGTATAVIDGNGSVTFEDVRDELEAG